MTETLVVKLPRAHMRIGSGKSEPLDVRLPASARGLLARGRATLSLRAKWTAGGQEGHSSHDAGVR
jgi:hypothetical protein